MPTRMCVVALALLAGLGLPAPDASAQDAQVVSLNDPRTVGTRVTLQFPAGDQLTGRLISVENGQVTIRHAVLGDVTLPVTQISRAVRPVVVGTQEFAPANPDAFRPVTEPEPDPVAEAATPARAAPPEPEVQWTREFELGLRGSSGNTDLLNFDTSLLLVREDSKGIFTFDTSYFYSQEDGEDTANRLDALVRNEWKLSDPKWTFFVQANYLLDEFQDFDYRLAGGLGIGYQVIDDDTTSLKLRLGAGASREFGDMADEDVIPELILGADFTHNINDNTRILASTEIFPNLSETGEFRSISSAGLEIDIDRGNGLSFRVGAEHRYDSLVEDAEKSDLDYFARIVYSF
ncbi:MAG: DUF481 domain-containing protein [Planctomycetota bacterium]